MNSIIKINLIILMLIGVVPCTRAGKYKIIIKGPHDLLNKMMKIKGTAKEILDIDDVWKGESHNLAISNYRSMNPPHTGVVY